MAENEENQAKNTNRFPSPLLPKGKSVAQCFNYCWVYFQLMRVQHLLEPRLESKGLRQGLEDPLRGCHTHTHYLVPKLPSSSRPLSCCICCRAMAAFSLPLCSAMLKSVWLGEAVQPRCPCQSPGTLGRRGHRGGRWGMGQQVSPAAVLSLSADSDPRVLLRSLHPKQVCWWTRDRKRQRKG